ncbi:MAG: DoxX family protein [Chlamydiota bacterium]
MLLGKFYLGLIPFGNKLQSLLLLIIRLCWGWLFFTTGLSKFMDIQSVISYFTSLGLPMPALSAYAASSIELIGGICLFFGVASRLICIPLIGNMTVAFLAAESAAVVTIFLNPINFITRTPFTFLFVAVLIFVFGPGKISVDYLLVKFVFKIK